MRDIYDDRVLDSCARFSGSAAAKTAKTVLLCAFFQYLFMLLFAAAWIWCQVRSGSVPNFGGLNPLGSVLRSRPAPTLCMAPSFTHRLEWTSLVTCWIPLDPCFCQHEAPL